jgi:hypothetical protein
MGWSPSRAVTAPLVIGGAVALAASLVGGIVAATSDVAVPNALVVGAVGAAALLLGLLLQGYFRRRAELRTAEVIPIPLAPRARRTRIAAGLLALVAAALLVLAVSGPGASFASLLRGGDAMEDALGVASDDVTDPLAPLGTEEFSFSQLQGVVVPGVTGIGGTGTTDQTHPLDVPAGATSARLELVWTAGSGQATELELFFENVTDGAVEVLGEATGGSVLVLDVTGMPAEPRELRAHVSLPDGAASAPVSYTLYVAYFAGDVPADYTGVPQDG